MHQIIVYHFCNKRNKFGAIFATFFDHFEDTPQKYEFMTIVAIAIHNSNNCHVTVSLNSTSKLKNIDLKRSFSVYSTCCHQKDQKT
jgi:hypothetical protein